MEEKRPVYYITDGDGIDQIAFVKHPAILSKGVYLNNHKQAFTSELKLQVAAPAMIPDMRIYRYDEDLGEFDVVFTGERIRSLVKKWALKDVKNKFNQDHLSEMNMPSVILESWFVEDPETDISYTKYGLGPYPKDTYFVVSQFREEDREMFIKEIIEGGRTGYSIEGYLGLELSRIKEKIKQEKMKNTKNRFEKMDTASGGQVFIDGGLAVDSYVFTAQPTIQLIDGKRSEMQYPVWDTIIELMDGTLLTLDCGKIVSLEKKEAVVPATEDVKKEDKPVEEIPVDEVKTETKKEEKMADENQKPDEVVTDENTTTDTVDTVEDVKEDDMQAKVMEVVKPLLDDVYTAIAELKTMVEKMETKDGSGDKGVIESKMTAVDSLVSFIKSR